MLCHYVYCRAALVLLLGQVTPADQEWKTVLEEIRLNVAAQLDKTTNYTCVETLERRFWERLDAKTACRLPVAIPKAQPTSMDRMRLDIAVSGGAEIFSWHGESKFTSANVADVITDGPSASGSFVGYLGNIFRRAGVDFTFVSETAESYKFEYHVRKPVSGFKVNSVAVGFHGAFLADAETLRLRELTVIPDELPEDSKLCAVGSTVEYTADHAQLIPHSVELLIGSGARPLFTETRMEYAGCRAFGSESSLRFDTDETASQTQAAVGGPPAPLPEHAVLHIALGTRLTDQTAYAGDAIAGALKRALKLDGGLTIPAGTPVHGVVKKLVVRYGGQVPIFLLKLEFDSLTYGGKTYTFHATARFEEAGMLLLKGKHFDLGERFTAEYETREPAVARVPLQ